MRIEDQRVHHRLIQIMIDPVRELTGRDQLFAVRAVTDIHEQGIIRNLLFLVGWQIVKILVIH